MTDVAPTEDVDFEALAIGRMSNVLGPSTARRVFKEVMEEAGLGKLRSADDLYAFAQRLTMRGGFEAAVGGLLCVAAVMRGAASRLQ